MAVIHSKNTFLDKVAKFCATISLDDDAFEEMSRRAERELRDNPSLYLANVISLAVFGYAFILLVAFLLILALAAIVKFVLFAGIRTIIVGKLLWLALVPLFVIAKSLWLKVPEPTGIEVKSKEAPELFALIKELCHALNTRVDKVLLDSNYNAGVVQVPRLGFFGFHKNILVLGMPLMLTQRPDQFRAILAHELGHLSSNHSRSGAWIYRLRGQWAKLLATISEAGRIFFVAFFVFFSWFSPRFSAYTLAMARSHELEADANAIKIAGGESFVRAMLALPVYAKFLGADFWPGIKELIRDNPQAPDDVYMRLKERASLYCPAANDLEKTLKDALDEKASGNDTHPPLAVRLAEDVAAIKTGDIAPGIIEAVGRPVTTEESAAHKFLNACLDSTLKQLSSQWQIENALGWEAEHKYHLEKLEHLKTLVKKEAEGSLTINELKLRAFLISQTQNAKAAIPVLEEILVRSPKETGSRFNLGLTILADDFDSGFRHIQQAIGERSTLLPEACELLMPLLKEKHLDEESTKLESQLTQFKRESELARKERLSVDGDSLLDTHGLEQDDIEYIRSVFEQLPTIKEAYAVRKVVQHLPDCPYLVLGLQMRPSGGTMSGGEQNVYVAQWLMENLQLPYEFCISIFDNSTEKLKKRMLSMDDSLVYRK